MTQAAVSVIVVSHQRPKDLLCCLTALGQQTYRNFEIVVVADATGVTAVERAGLADDMKLAEFNERNISAARNLGLAQAAGQVVAFIDDDAAAEPTWLQFLTDPFDQPEVAAAGGYVRGRNGISYQSTAHFVDNRGTQTPIALPAEEVAVLPGHPGCGIKTEGTNCAFRRDVLAGMGGFDPAFRFYLDETDVNLRLAGDHRTTAIVPLAQVHHGFAPSAQRLSSRMPRTLFDVGASQVAFLRKHASGLDFDSTLDKLRKEQRARLLRHMVAGNCEPQDVDSVLATLEAGIIAGRDRDIRPLRQIGRAAGAFKMFRPGRPAFRAGYLAGRPWAKRRLHRQAQDRARAGECISIFLFSPTALYHRVAFDARGYWVQQGGIFGRSDRKQPLFQLLGFKSRVAAEIDRVKRYRGLG